MLLNQSGHYQVVASEESGIMQHNALTWEVLGTSFVYKEGLSSSSVLFNNALRAWLDTVSNEERAEFIEALFTIL
jgi:hypothetical protein